MTTKKIVKFSNVLPVSHLVLLSIATFGIYELVWFGKNWGQLKQHKNSDIKPGWRVVGLFVPIYNLFLMHGQFSDIKSYAEKAGVKKLYSAGWLLWAYVILIALSKLPDPYWLLSFFSVLPLTVVQKTLNEYWKIEQHELPEKEKLTRGEFALVSVGGFLAVLGIVGTFIPE